MKQLRDMEVLRALSKQKLETTDLEFCYASRKYRTRVIKNTPIPFHKFPCGETEAVTQRRRPVRACTKQQPQTQRRKRDIEEQECWNGYSLLTGLPVPEAAVRKKPKAKKVEKVEKPVLAYPSVEHAIKEKRLFHSVLQSPFTVGEYNDGIDSDSNDGTEPEWRLRLSQKEINEYIDTIAIEKLFMHLWNQFIRMEYFVYADHRVAPACMLFAKSTLLRQLFLLFYAVWQYN